MTIYRLIEALDAKDKGSFIVECVFIKLFQNTGDFIWQIHAQIVRMGWVLFGSNREQLVPFCLLVSPWVLQGWAVKDNPLGHSGVLPVD